LLMSASYSSAWAACAARAAFDAKGGKRSVRLQQCDRRKWLSRPMTVRFQHAQHARRFADN